jgi:hypothetical protein
MPRQLRIFCDDQHWTAQLNEGATADALWAALPIDSRASTWGEEIYFSIPVEAALEADAQAAVALGEIAYWPPGTAFCIFFGRTPASTGAAPVAASPVNVLGKIDGDLSGLHHVRSGAPVRLEQA